MSSVRSPAELVEAAGQFLAIDEHVDIYPLGHVPYRIAQQWLDACDAFEAASDKAGVAWPRGSGISYYRAAVLAAQQVFADAALGELDA